MRNSGASESEIDAARKDWDAKKGQKKRDKEERRNQAEKKRQEEAEKQNQRNIELATILIKQLRKLKIKPHVLIKKIQECGVEAFVQALKKA